MMRNSEGVSRLVSIIPSGRRIMACLLCPNRIAVSLGKEVYDRYNLAINPARGGVAGIPVERLYSRPRTLSYSLREHEEALMNAIRIKTFTRCAECSG